MGPLGPSCVSCVAPRYGAGWGDGGGDMAGWWLSCIVLTGGSSGANENYKCIYWHLYKFRHDILIFVVVIYYSFFRFGLTYLSFHDSGLRGPLKKRIILSSCQNHGDFSFERLSVPARFNPETSVFGWAAAIQLQQECGKLF